MSDKSNYVNSYSFRGQRQPPRWHPVLRADLWVRILPLLLLLGQAVLLVGLVKTILAQRASFVRYQLRVVAVAAITDHADVLRLGMDVRCISADFVPAWIRSRPRGAGYSPGAARRSG